MLLPSLAILAGLVLLTWSADRFVHGAASLARILGAPPLLIGITIIGIGTSAPEILVSLSASLTGSPNLAVGNAIGSNITNIALVLGLTAVIAPLRVQSGILRRELPIVLGLSLLVLVMCLDLKLSQLEGGLLCVGFLVVFAWMIHIGRTGRLDDPMLSEMVTQEETTLLPKNKAWIWIGVGLVMLPLSAQMLVYGASEIARAFGISELVIGLTIVAFGTSLPELAAALASARRNEADLAMGNVLGSNMFNLFLVLGLPGVIAAPELEREVLVRDLPMMVGLTAALFVMAWGWKGPGRINRIEGGVLLAAFVGYELILAASTNLF